MLFDRDNCLLFPVLSRSCTESTYWRLLEEQNDAHRLAGVIKANGAPLHSVKSRPLCHSGSLQPAPWNGRPRYTTRPFKMPEGASFPSAHWVMHQNKECIREYRRKFTACRCYYVHFVAPDKRTHKSTTHLAAVLGGCSSAVIKHGPKPT